MSITLMSSFSRPQQTPDADGEVKRDARVRARPLYDVPYMFEAREFLRKKLIGKKVHESSF